ncbi:hypothetical protein KUV44_06435 [Marinobacter daepoensis]|uniref:DUF445 domain-containing protein n=1 Tax=Marinobacter daepoensis TaxID=262077 RepID=A0ABS3BHT3_9GAMM|nr:hypothetical protein [Marinobacter daepoensis]MBN7770905.1 hypothetical protein [Marinobacter daepoensis]MBY6033251.1 hypothetical protein [Marinobacter daepoensis]MBY6078767.1 hypothetical protein [Marinobacter daepoensis]
MTDLLTNPEFWQYLSIPVIAALIGWSTNWLAIKMTFYPLEFIGKPPLLGWQGIIPSKARKMAAKSVDATIAKIGTVQEIFEQIDPKVLAAHIIHTVDPRVEEYVDELMLREYPTFWENLPASARKMVYDRVRKSTPQLVDNLVEDISDNIEDLLDIKGMVIDRLARDKKLLNRIFLECGDVEFRFIVNSGLYFGFLFGIIQMGVWFLYPAIWVLPLFGLLVGWATNWIALNVIFRPLHEHKVGPLRIQGLFLKRQPEVAESFCHIVTHEILTVGNIIDAILGGPKGDRARNMVKKHIKPLVDETAGMGKALTQMAFGPTGFATLKNQVGEKALAISQSSFSNPVFERDRARAVEAIMVERMNALSSEEFQDLLRPCFQEDEIKLILVGAFLGMIAGVCQLVFVFGESFT